MKLSDRVTIPSDVIFNSLNVVKVNGKPLWLNNTAICAVCGEPRSGESIYCERHRRRADEWKAGK